VDGEGIGAIPDPDVYLDDDFGGGWPTDRDDSGTTTYNGVEGFYRPDWTIDSGDPDAADDILNLTSGDRTFTPINLNFDETITWEWTDIDVTASGDSASDYFILQPFATQSQDTSFGTFHEGYSIELRSGGDGTSRLRVRDEDGTPTDLIEGDEFSTGDVKITRSPDGEWEYFINGTSQGTETDTAFENAEITAISTNDDGAGSVDQYKAN